MDPLDDMALTVVGGNWMSVDIAEGYGRLSGPDVAR